MARYKEDRTPVTFRINKTLLERIDQEAHKCRINRTEFFNMALEKTVRDMESGELKFKTLALDRED